ncbi:MAG: geranylgeranyl reductase family protein [Planctomycetes bacterium]|nr:geranylgeranyl reductase family protein [Planctomycetota bacterium]
MSPQRRYRSVAVIGGGPAGSAAAAELSAAGMDTTIFHVDSPHGEKPCGGGITARAFDEFHYLNALPCEGNPIHKITLVAPSGGRVDVASTAPMIKIYNRGELDAALRERAARAGARILGDAAIEVAPSGDAVSILTKSESYTFDAVVGADGAFSKTRRAVVGEVPKSYFCPAVDELVEGIDPASGVVLAFFKDITGYLWVFPRRNIASVGLVAREGQLNGDEMRRRVRNFIKFNYPGAKSVRSVGWTIPAPDAKGGLPARPVYKHCILCGDAAGIADPLTGEGIYYALLSGTLAARALIAGDPELYLDLLNKAAGAELERAGRFADRYFRARTINAIVLAARCSRRIRALLADLLSGRQHYADLDRRIRRDLRFTSWALRKL